MLRSLLATLLMCSGLMAGDSPGADLRLVPPSGTYGAVVPVVPLVRLSAGERLVYTVDGSDPTDASWPANKPILVTDTTTLRVATISTHGVVTRSVSGTYIVSGVLTTTRPVAAPPAGAYPASQLVTLTCATAGATIRYTLDGRQPTTSSARYTAPITIAASATLRAQAFGGQLSVRIGRFTLRVPAVFPSGVMTAVYVITGQQQQVATPVIAPASGLYRSGQIATATSSTPGAEVRYRLDGTDPGPADAIVPVGGVAIDASVTLSVRAFRSDWEDSAVAQATYTLQVPEPAITPASSLANAPFTASVTIPAGAIVRYTTDGTDPSASSPAVSGPIPVDHSLQIRAQAQRAGWTPSAIIATAYTLQPLPPVASLPTGSHVGPQTVTLSAATSAVTIRYTLDGTVPTAGSPVATGPIDLPGSVTLTAVASRAGWTDSQPLVVAYALQVPTPTLQPTAGTYTTAPTIAATGTGTIRYTVDGSTPTAASAALPAGFVLDQSATLTIAAFRDGWQPSAPVSAVYVLQVEAVIASVPAGSYVGGQSVTLTTPTPGAQIRYTLDGSVPTAASPVATGPITLPGSATLTALAFRDGWAPSAAGSWVYTLQVPTPTLTPAGGSYPAPLTVATTTPGSSAEFHYTVDGSTPTVASPVWPAGGLSLMSSTTLQVIAAQTGWEPSSVVSAVYEFQSPPPPSAPPVVSQVTLTITGGLTGDGTGTWNGEEVSFTNQETVQVLVTATADAPITGVQVLISGGSVVSGQAGTTLVIPLPADGRLELTATAMASRDGLSAQGATAAPVVLISDRTAPRISWRIAGSTAGGSAESIPAGDLWLGSGTAAACAAVRTAYGQRCYPAQSFTMEGTWDDVSGPATGVPPVTATVQPGGAAANITLTTGGLTLTLPSGMGVQATVDAATLLWTLDPAACVTAAMRDRCGNLVSSEILRVRVQTDPPRAAVGGLAREPSGSQETVINTDGWTDMTPVQTVVTSADVIRVEQSGGKGAVRLTSGRANLNDGGHDRVLWRVISPVIPGEAMDLKLINVSGATESITLSPRLRISHETAGPLTSMISKPGSLRCFQPTLIHRYTDGMGYVPDLLAMTSAEGFTTEPLSVSWEVAALSTLPLEHVPAEIPLTGSGWSVSLGNDDYPDNATVISGPPVFPMRIGRTTLSEEASYVMPALILESPTTFGGSAIINLSTPIGYSLPDPPYVHQEGDEELTMFAGHDGGPEQPATPVSSVRHEQGGWIINAPPSWTTSPTVSQRSVLNGLRYQTVTGYSGGTTVVHSCGGGVIPASMEAVPKAGNQDLQVQVSVNRSVLPGMGRVTWSAQVDGDYLPSTPYAYMVYSYLYGNNGFDYYYGPPLIDSEYVYASYTDSTRAPTITIGDPGGFQGVNVVRVERDVLNAGTVQQLFISGGFVSGDWPNQNERQIHFIDSNARAQAETELPQPDGDVLSGIGIWLHNRHATISYPANPAEDPASEALSQELHSRWMAASILFINRLWRGSGRPAIPSSVQLPDIRDAAMAGFVSAIAIEATAKEAAVVPGLLAGERRARERLAILAQIDVDRALVEGVDAWYAEIEKQSVVNFPVSLEKVKELEGIWSAWYSQTFAPFLPDASYSQRFIVNKTGSGAWYAGPQWPEWTNYTQEATVNPIYYVLDYYNSLQSRPDYWTVSSLYYSVGRARLNPELSQAVAIAWADRTQPPGEPVSPWRIGVISDRLEGHGHLAPLSQTWEITCDVGAQALGLYDLDIICGKVHAYPDELSQQYAGANGAHRMKEALCVTKVEYLRSDGSLINFKKYNGTQNRVLPTVDSKVLNDYVANRGLSRPSGSSQNMAAIVSVQGYSCRADLVDVLTVGICDGASGAREDVVLRETGPASNGFVADGLVAGSGIEASISGNETTKTLTLVNGTALLKATLVSQGSDWGAVQPIIRLSLGADSITVVSLDAISTTELPMQFSKVSEGHFVSVDGYEIEIIGDFSPSDEKVDTLVVDVRNATGLIARRGAVETGPSTSEYASIPTGYRNANLIGADQSPEIPRLVPFRIRVTDMSRDSESFVVDMFGKTPDGRNKILGKVDVYRKSTGVYESDLIIAVRELSGLSSDARSYLEGQGYKIIHGEGSPLVIIGVAVGAYVVLNVGDYLMDEAFLKAVQWLDGKDADTRIFRVHDSGGWTVGLSVWDQYEDIAENKGWEDSDINSYAERAEILDDLADMDGDDIFVFHGHAAGHVTDGEAQDIVGLTGYDSFGYRDLIPHQEMSAYMGESAPGLVIISGCASFFDPMKTAFMNKGCKAYIGWNDTIPGSVSGGVMDKLLKSLFDGDTINTAIQKANTHEALTVINQGRIAEGKPKLELKVAGDGTKNIHDLLGVPKPDGE
jgi:hypothetical protein